MTKTSDGSPTAETAEILADPEAVRGLAEARESEQTGDVTYGIQAAEKSTSLRDAIEHLAADAERLRRLAAISDVA